MKFMKAKLFSKNKVLFVEADYDVTQDDLMTQNGCFHAFWNETTGLWDRCETNAMDAIDRELETFRSSLQEESVIVNRLSVFSSGAVSKFRSFLRHHPDNFKPFDSELIFEDTVATKDMYATKKLPYRLSNSEPEAYNKLISVLYSPEEREKIEWAIGSVFAKESCKIQKFFVLYGMGGSGKSTVLNIIEMLFDGYLTHFDAKSLTSTSNAFSVEAFKNNPLVAVQHDADLSRVETNVLLNSIVAHETITMNEKYKSAYPFRPRAILFMGTNSPVQITDAKSGLKRRLIDIHPTGNRLPFEEYQDLMARISFERGAIANRCLKVFKRLGKNYYDDYIPQDMMERTDYFFNFITDYELELKDGIHLKRAYELYKSFCEESGLSYSMNKQKFRDELKNYYAEFHKQLSVNGRTYSNYYTGFSRIPERKYISSEKKELTFETSLLDSIFADCQAQYATEDDKPSACWENVRTTLKELDTSKVHYVRPLEGHIVIDFDIKDEDGNKSFELNMREASKFPPTYMEVSKGGQGLHLHYIYDGDTSKLSSIFSEDIEIKTFPGKSSLRRKVTKCNDLPVAHISEGLPLKGEKAMIDFDRVQTEKGLREMILRNLRKEIHPYTKPSVDFIYKILQDAYESDLVYDVRDLQGRVIAFAAKSTHQSTEALRVVSKMHFWSKEIGEEKENDEEASMVFFDCEVFPNLFLVNWKYAGENQKCVRMINPKPEDMEELFKYRLVGFNCRRYDNHILYARYLGYSNLELFNLSQKIVTGGYGCFFTEAYNISYTDVYDFASAANKKSLKKFEIELGIHHQELGIPWDKPVDEKDWEMVAAYCDNDVLATEAVFNHLRGDWAARQILAQLSGLSVNATTNSHSTQIIFGKNRNTGSSLVYTDLSEMFPGYKFEKGVSTYRGETVGEGGYVYAEPGVYSDVAVLDVASMHPTSIEQLNLLGPYTKRFSDLKQARVAIKHNDKEALSHILDGKLVPFLEDDSISNKDLSNALKTVINSVYGLTAASFDNPFRDRRNRDNIVAKRGALFMVDLKNAVQEQGYQVIHIKTDSIKIPEADDYIIQFVMDFGKKYGYIFEHEETYDRICLVNRAVYIALTKDKKWTATGAQFAEPYIFKTLFTKEPLIFEDFIQTKSVSGGAMHLDMGGGSEHDYRFVGRVGAFVPVVKDGGILVREKDGKYSAVTGTTGYLWMEAETAKEYGQYEDIVDMRYYRQLASSAIEDISQYCDFEIFSNAELDITTGILPF